MIALRLSLVVSLCFATPLLGQKCAQPRLGDRVDVSYELGTSSFGDEGTLGRRGATTSVKGTLFGYEGDTLRLATGRSSRPLDIPFRSVKRMYVACGHDWVTPSVAFAVVGAAVGYLLGSFNPFGPIDRQEQYGLAGMGALVSLPLGLTAAALSTRWIKASGPPPPGILPPSEVRRHAGRPGRGKLHAGLGILATTATLLACDGSLSNDGFPRLMAATGISLGVWGLIEGSRSR